MQCFNCKENEATKTYEQVKNGKKSVSYYCLDCYHRLFLYVEEAEGEESLSACPYCGITLSEFKAKKLVGCAYCYRTMTADIMPMIIKMQGAEAHKGKNPPLESEEAYEGNVNVKELFLGNSAYEAEARKQARFHRQCNELESVIAKLVADGDEAGAKEYQDKLRRMKRKGEVEEEFVWRKRLNLSKQS